MLHFKSFDKIDQIKLQSASKVNFSEYQLFGITAEVGELQKTQMALD